jgi:hypothetical protein
MTHCLVYENGILSWHRRWNWSHCYSWQEVIRIYMIFQAVSVTKTQVKINEEWRHFLGLLIRKEWQVFKSRLEKDWSEPSLCRLTWYTKWPKSDKGIQRRLTLKSAYFGINCTSFHLLIKKKATTYIVWITRKRQNAGVHSSSKLQMEWFNLSNDSFLSKLNFSLGIILIPYYV